MKFSVSKLEQYRRFRDMDADYGPSVKEVENAIMGKFVRLPQMVRGAAFHDVVADPARYRARGLYRCKGWRFPVEETDEVIRQIGAKTCEVSGSWTREGLGHTVTMKADGIAGRVIKEVKVPMTPSKFKLEYYEEPCQWRCYLLGLDADVCEYQIVALEEDKEEQRFATPVLEDSRIGERCIPMNRYAGMEDDVVGLIKDFEAFVLDRHMESYLGG